MTPSRAVIGTYGSPRIHAALVDSGVEVGLRRVAETMSDAGIVGVTGREHSTATTRRDRMAAPLPDLVGRNFTPATPNALWYGDVTYIWIVDKFWYLATVIDAATKLYAKYKANDFKLEISEDPRITSIGRFLRRSSLDELPQLINVLHGEMSLVGPRPVLRDELELYGPWAEAYMAVFPGVTGRWQVEGRNNIRFPERYELDARYADEWTLRGDLSLIARTIPAVLRNEGVS